MRPRRASPVPHLGFLLLLAGVACAPGRAPQVLPAPSREELRPQPGAFVARWKGRAETGGEARGFRLGVLGAPPDRFVLEISGRVGGPVLRAAHDGERLQVLLIRDRLFVDEPAGPEAMERLLGFPLEPGALLAVIVGRVLPPPYPDRERETREAAPGELRLGPTGWPVGGRLEVYGAEPVEVAYGDLVSGGSEGGVLPERIDLSWSGRGHPLAARLSLRSSHGVSAASPDQFRLTPPRGFRPVGLRELVGEGSLLLDAAESEEESQESVAREEGP